jgi:hypothetical protein
VLQSLFGRGILGPLKRRALSSTYDKLRQELRTHACPAPDTSNLDGTLLFHFVGLAAYASGQWDQLETVGKPLYRHFERVVQKLHIEAALTPLIPEPERVQANGGLEDRQSGQAEPADNRWKTVGHCFQCGQRLAVPSGRGRLRVTCPRCGAKWETRT